METLALVTFAAAFAMTLVLTPLAKRLAPKLGLMDSPGERKLQAELNKRQCSCGRGVDPPLLCTCGISHLP